MPCQFHFEKRFWHDFIHLLLLEYALGIKSSLVLGQIFDICDQLTVYCLFRFVWVILDPVFLLLRDIGLTKVFPKDLHLEGYLSLWLVAKQKLNLLKRNCAVLCADPFSWQCSLVRDSLPPSWRSLPHSSHIPPLFMLGGRLPVAKSIVGNPNEQAP